MRRGEFQHGLEGPRYDHRMTQGFSEFNGDVGSYRNDLGEREGV